MTATQLAAVIIAALGIVAWVWFAVRNRRQWMYSVPPASWLAHVLVFYVAVWLIDGQAQMLNAWSTIVRLHGVILATGAAVVLLITRKK